jgi:hypothetical protein
VLCIGGTTAGTRMLPLAHSLGFRKFALFGLDCSYRKGATWAGPHSGKPHGVIEVICPPPDGRKFFTSPNMLAASDDLFLFIDLTLKARECEFTFVGDTLLSERIKVVFSQGTG